MFKAKVTTVSLCVALAGCFGTADAAERTKARTGNVPMVQDWSTNQTAFRNPMTAEEAKARGEAQYKRWQRLASDPRFMLALANKLEFQATLANGPAVKARKGGGNPPPPPPPPQEAGPHRDWSNVLGGGANGAGGGGPNLAGVFPAKFQFNYTLPPDCTNDFVVYPTNAAGATANGTHETWAANITADPVAGEQITLTSVAVRRTVTLTAHASSNTGANFQIVAGDFNQTATNLRDAVNRWSGQSGFSASGVSPNVNIRLDSVGNPNGTTGAGVFNENVSGWAPVNANGSAVLSGQASIVAFNQLYNTQCAPTRTPVNAANPSVLWAYNTAGTVKTSPVISYFDNGKQVVFIQQSNASDNAELVILKWKAGEGTPGLPIAPAPATAAEIRNYASGPCAGTNSCMFKTTLIGTPDVSFSSPFVDYFNDVLYVGDDVGSVHKITSVMSGTPAEVNGSGFPSSVTSTALSSPVYDFNGHVFVGSASAGGAVGGALHRVDAADGTIKASSAKLAPNNSPGVRASPMLDVSSGRVYIFLAQSSVAVGTASDCNNTPCRAVYDFAGNFTGGTSGNPIRIGRTTGPGSPVQYFGAFDQAWYNTGTGSIYVCGRAPTDAATVVLWKIPVSASGLSAGTMGATIATATPTDCSPVKRFTNTNTNKEYLFVSTPGGAANVAGCTSTNCVYTFDLAAAWGPANTPVAGLNSPGGTSGMVVDNNSSNPDAAQLYYAQPALSGNAIQARQSTLQ